MLGSRIQNLLALWIISLTCFAHTHTHLVQSFFTIKGGNRIPENADRYAAYWQLSSRTVALQVWTELFPIFCFRIHIHIHVTTRIAGTCWHLHLDLKQIHKFPETGHGVQKETYLRHQKINSILSSAGAVLRPFDTLPLLHSGPLPSSPGPLVPSSLGP